METADFNNELSARPSSLVVSTVLKMEIALAILFFFEISIDLALVLAGACAIVNQMTEIRYLKKRCYDKNCWSSSNRFR